MRALLIGDIHTEHELLIAALACGAAANVDKILSVGDIVDGPNDPLACIALLVQHRADVVSGNHERWVVDGHPLEPFDYPPEALDWLRALPATREYATPTGLLLLGHGLGTNDMARLDPDTDGYALECLDPLWRLVDQGRYRYFIGGHTHVPMVRTIEGLTVINPGTWCCCRIPGA
jgi:predicted phosphodiesterase